jgi:putative addiction module CopG family antidote
MPTETVTLTEEQTRIVRREIEAGRFSSPAEVVGAALQVLRLEEDEYNEKLAALRADIEEGFASGVAEGDVFARVRQQHGLPPRSRS